MFRNRAWNRKLFIFALTSSLFVLASVTSISKPFSWLSIGLSRADDGDESTSGTSSVDRIKARGYLICGVNGELPGFSFVNSDGDYAGIDVDFCRAIAAALFNDPQKVKFRNVTAQERFSVLKSGAIDLLSRNTTKTLSRDSDKDLEFTPPIFYDAQGIMVNRNSQIEDFEDLKNKSICVTQNTTSYDNLLDYLRQADIEVRVKASDDLEALYRLYEYDQCQAITGDISQLVARRTILANPKNHLILSQTISQEPLAPMLIHQDSAWFDVVKWVTFALFQAEELGITSENLSTYKRSKESEIRRFLGLEGNLGSGMKLSNDFTERILKHVGNYGEIYERNLGQPFGLPRGKNALWKNGGLIYSPPFN